MTPLRHAVKRFKPLFTLAISKGFDRDLALGQRQMAELSVSRLAMDAQARCAEWLLDHAQPIDRESMAVQFTQRKRQGDLEGLLAQFPQYLGIGLDETTAILVRGEIAKVLGKHHAHFFDPSRKRDDGRPHQDAVPHGGVYDLVRRRVIELPESATSK